MPRKYQRKTESKGPTDDELIEMLKKIKIDNLKLYAVSHHYNFPQANLYRLIAAFDKQMLEGEPVTEEKLKQFVISRNQHGGKTVSFH